ncbi:MAG: phosphatase PAP2 family protein [Defluviimonas sp.]|uniref:phosphatase PAP2 family protein n=1 Tax=Albidovulum sp. TaxID=1872424 RepID=UPI002A31164A|nr:phosphatase PAP2 family protein [Defluviimonas sp.]
MPPGDLGRAWILLAAAYAAAAVIFSLWPGIDLWVSGLFYRPGAGFFLARSGALELLRETVWGASVLVALAAAGLLVLSALGRPLPIGTRAEAAFVFLLYLLGPVLLVDGLLKRFWGRARPASVTEFGGTLDFTVALVPADQCHRNCAFVSGEGAAAAALGVTFALVLPRLLPQLPPRMRRPMIALAILLPLAGMALRVMTGRHFLSDTVFAVLFVMTIALALGRFLRRADGRCGAC